MQFQSKMNFLCLLIVLRGISITIATNGSFIDEYLNPSIRPYCSETQEKLEFRYSFRGRKTKNINSHVVYLFTEDMVFAIPSMTVALDTLEKNSYVIPELFFDEVVVKSVTEFWNGLLPNDTFNAMFSDPNPELLEGVFLLFDDYYRFANISVSKFEVTKVGDRVQFSQGMYGFLSNKKIEAKGFKNIFAVDIADASAFHPIRVYVRDLQNDGKAISFAFQNETETVEEFAEGKHYPYSFDTAAFLVYARSLNSKPKAEQYNHYFELRTRKGTFSVFDITYNRNFLLIGTNEELLGCPPSFCHSRQFDDIIRLHDRTQLLVYHEWVWNFTKPGLKLKWEDAVLSDMASRMHITKAKNFKSPFKFGIRHIVDGSFTDGSTLYIFRNGSFVSSDDDTIVRNNTAFTGYTPISQLFKGVPSLTFDALFYNKVSRNVFFIKEDKYWGYSMAKKALIAENFPKHVENLGFPYDFRVTSTYVEEDDSGKQTEFYFFTENRYIVFKENEFKGDRFQARKHTYYCTSVSFFGCTESQFVCPEIETTPSMTDTPDLSENKPNIWLYLIILMVIIVVLVAIIAGFVFYVLNAKEPQKNPKDSTQSTQNPQSKPISKKGASPPAIASDLGSHGTSRSKLS